MIKPPVPVVIVGNCASIILYYLNFQLFIGAIFNPIALIEFEICNFLFEIFDFNSDSNFSKNYDLIVWFLNIYKLRSIKL